MLNIEPNLALPDEFYESLIETHRDLAYEQSVLVNCKLILLLANHIGDLGVLYEAMARARAGVQADVVSAVDPCPTPGPGSEP